MAWDGVVMWWETIILLCLYVCYWLLMFQNPKIMKFVKHVVEDRLMWCQRIKNYDIIKQHPKEVNPAGGVESETTTPRVNGLPSPGARESYKGVDNEAFEGSSPDLEAIERIKRNRSQSFDINAFDGPSKPRERRKSFDLSRIDEIEEEEFKIWELPREPSAFDIFWFFFTWPIRFALHYTIPNPIKYKKWFALTFILCIVWIGTVAYVVFWMVVVIGDTFRIPEPGMNLLALLAYLFIFIKFILSYGIHVASFRRLYARSYFSSHCNEKRIWSDGC